MCKICYMVDVCVASIGIHVVLTSQEAGLLLMMKILAQHTSHLSHTYLRYNHKSQNGGGANEEPSAEESRKHMDKLFQGVGRDCNDYKHNAGDINGCCDILGVIKALDLHLAS